MHADIRHGCLYSMISRPGGARSDGLHNADTTVRGSESKHGRVPMHVQKCFVLRMTCVRGGGLTSCDPVVCVARRHSMSVGACLRQLTTFTNVPDHTCYLPELKQSRSALVR